MPDSMGRIRNSLSHLGNEELMRLLGGITIADLDYVWDDLDEEGAIRIFTQLDLDKKVDLVNSLPAPDQESLVAALSADHAKVLLEEMEPDDLTDFIQAVSQ